MPYQSKDGSTGNLGQIAIPVTRPKFDLFETVLAVGGGGTGVPHPDQAGAGRGRDVPSHQRSSRESRNRADGHHAEECSSLSPIELHRISPSGLAVARRSDESEPGIADRGRGSGDPG